MRNSWEKLRLFMAIYYCSMKTRICCWFLVCFGHELLMSFCVAQSLLDVLRNYNGHSMILANCMLEALMWFSLDKFSGTNWLTKLKITKKVGLCSTGFVQKNWVAELHINTFIRPGEANHILVINYHRKVASPYTTDNQQHQ